MDKLTSFMKALDSKPSPKVVETPKKAHEVKAEIKPLKLGKNKRGNKISVIKI